MLMLVGKTRFLLYRNLIDYFVCNVEKWPNLILKSYYVHKARFLKYSWTFFNIMHERNE